MENETFVKDLPCVVTEAERDARGRSAALKRGEVDERRVALAKASKKEGDAIKEIEVSAKSDEAVVRTGRENRPVPCSHRPDMRRFQIEIVRHDTMEVIDTRPMNPEELEEAQQPGLFTRQAKETADSHDGDPEDHEAAPPPMSDPAAADDDAGEPPAIEPTDDLLEAAKRGAQAQADEDAGR